ncbi:MAG: hypothetical protein ABSF44_09405 [Candidatus Bathyarchaeia archaeon]
MSQETIKCPQCGSTKLWKDGKYFTANEKKDSVTFVENAGIGSQYVNNSQPPKKMEKYLFLCVLL